MPSGDGWDKVEGQVGARSQQKCERVRVSSGHRAAMEGAGSEGWKEGRVARGGCLLWGFSGLPRKTARLELERHSGS